MQIFQKIVLFACLLFVCGCNKKTPLIIPENDVITVDQIYNAVDADGLYSVYSFVTDSDYLVLDKGWVANSFSQSFSNFLVSIKQNIYISESNDCDDFSEYAYAYIRYLQHNKTYNKNFSVCFGKVYYLTDAGIGHAVNFFISSDGEVLFYEPQKYQIIELSKKEKINIFLWII